MNTESSAEKRRFYAVAIFVAAVAVAFIVLALLLNTGRGSQKGTLKAYYKAMYTQSGSFDDLCGCIVPSRRQEYYDTTSMAGTNFNFLAMWHTEAITQVGDNVKVGVRVLETGADDSAYLTLIRETYSAAERFSAVAFELRLDGDDGWETLTGVAPMIYQGGKWYMTPETVELSVTGRSE